MAYDPRPTSPLGWKVSVRHHVGHASTGGVEALLERETVDELAGSGTPGATRLEGRVGYGWPVRGGALVVTPWIGFGRAEGQATYRAGGKLQSVHRNTASFELALEAGLRQQDVHGTADREVILQLTTRW